MLERLLDEASIQRSAVKAVGMGLPAPIAAATGEVGALSILPGWVGINAAQLASEHLGLPVAVDNEANLGAWAEHLWGAGRGVANLAFMKLSEGVGAGLMLDGKLFRGPDGTAGEIGHTSVEDMGAICRCGNRGCLETVIAARAVTELLQPSFSVELTIADVVARAHDGDVACIRVLSDTGRQAGLALANLCNLFNPERILIGGELAQGGDLLLGPMRESVRRHAIPSATADLQIQVGSLGARAILMGTIALAVDYLSGSEDRSSSAN
ncbi:MAG TPA: ROK family protein, partial [Candidatus Nesterenkonia stercoripullorum]|nr:ROK family protein [Candidatus Nesterenkonia stercoripullorum]